MPYIRQTDRDFLEETQTTSSNCGELNYSITKLLVAYINKKGLSYQIINDIIGALEASKMEFNRRIVVPYEDIKITNNGDVYNVK